MAFTEYFQLTCPSTREAGSMQADFLPQPGVYNGGLLFIPDQFTSSQVLAGWQPLLGDAIALAITAFGDIFFWSPRFEAIFFLESQKGASTFVARDTNFLFDNFLIIPDVRENVLRESIVMRLIDNLGALDANECFIAEPMPVLGGDGSINSYSRCSLLVHSSLVAMVVLDSLRRG